MHMTSYSTGLSLTSEKLDLFLDLSYFLFLTLTQT